MPVLLLSPLVLYCPALLVSCARLPPVQVVIAYLMAYQPGQLTPAQALAQLRRAHPAAFPNAGKAHA